MPVTPTAAQPVKAADFRAATADAMTEAALEESVRTLCKVHNVVYVHHRMSKGTTPGWPDDALIGTRLLLRELKRAKGRVTPAQQNVMDGLRRAGQDVDVWRPADLVSGRISREIAAISPRQKSAIHPAHPSTTSSSPIAPCPRK